MRVFTFFLLSLFALGARTGKSQGLRTTFDQRGVASLSYNGATLVDLNAHVGDAFYVGGLDLGGVAGWGGTGATINWNALTQTETWTYSWGVVTCRFVTSSNRLSIAITVTNKSTQTLNGITIFPLGLQFPALPKGWSDPTYAQFHNNLDAPTLIPADFGSGMTVLANDDAKQLYVGFSPSAPTLHYALQVGTRGDGTQGFLSSAVPVNRPIAPGASDSYSVSLRFGSSGTDYHTLAGDVLTTYAKTWPQTLAWSDRRPIGELFVSSPTSSPVAASSPNPRQYSFAQNTDIRTSAGLKSFQSAVLAYADRAVQLLKNMNAQGAIVWDLEGQQYPQPNTSYVGDPTALSKMAPEMNGIADQFFKRFTDAGLRCGMTIRPQTLDFTVAPPNQKTVPATSQTALLTQKISYAYNRWGCTLFYVDSDGGPLDSTPAAVFQQVAKSLPNVLLIPENIWPKDSAYTAPLASFTAPYKPLHTPADERTMWPGAFRVTYIGDAPDHDLSNNPSNPNQWNEFVQAVKGGDILSFRAWFDDEPLNNQVLEIYQAAASQK